MSIIDIPLQNTPLLSQKVVCFKKDLSRYIHTREYIRQLKKIIVSQCYINVNAVFIID